MTARNDLDTLLRAWMTDVADARPRRGRPCDGHGAIRARGNMRVARALRVGPAACGSRRGWRYSGPRGSCSSRSSLSWHSCSSGSAWCSPAIAVRHRRSGPPRTASSRSTRVVASSSGRRRGRAVETLTSRHDGVRTPVWSNDGRRLAYWARRRRAGFALVIDALDGTQPVEHPVEPAGARRCRAPSGLGARWRPDRVHAKDDGAHGCTRCRRMARSRCRRHAAVVVRGEPGMVARRPSPRGDRDPASNPSGRGDAALYVVDPLDPSDPGDYRRPR